MPYVPATAVLCSESIECFPGVASKSLFKPFVTITVTSDITGMIINVMFHILCISIQKYLYFNFFSTSSLPDILVRWYCHILLLLLLLHYTTLHVTYIGTTE